MKQSLFTSIFLIFSLSILAQTYQYCVRKAIDNVDINQLTMQVNKLTGEQTVNINGQIVSLINRNDYYGAEYIKQQLASYNLEPVVQEFSETGKNIFSIQKGSLYPEQYYVICAHYDIAHLYAADDNASGTAAVLEAARILSCCTFEYSIIYAFWDEEELNLAGSQYFARLSTIDQTQILGVINLDMIGWDGDQDRVTEIHTNYDERSLWLANYIRSIDILYSLGIVPVTETPGTGSSDHRSFWEQGYPAILIMEEKFGEDFNPFYHTSNDRVSEFNLDYYHETARLAIGTITSLAQPYDATGVDSKPDQSKIQLFNYPNPFSKSTTVAYTLEQRNYLRLILINSQGAEVRMLLNRVVEAGQHEIILLSEELPCGLYFLQAQTVDGTIWHKMIIQ